MSKERQGRFGDPVDHITSPEEFVIPEGAPYFSGVSERCVEIPLVFSRLYPGLEVLDIGVSLADRDYFAGLMALVDNGCKLTSLDIVPISKVMNRFTGFASEDMVRMRFVRGDVRACPFLEHSFDAVLCVSVLEHVGFDKYIDSPDTVFQRPVHKPELVDRPEKWNEDAKALAEMLRVVRPGGRLLLTVPFGAGGVFFTRDSKGLYAIHLEYNKKTWHALISGLAESYTVCERVFRMMPDVGWREVGLDSVFPKTLSREQHIDQGVLCAEIINCSHNIKSMHKEGFRNA